jgi:hypothetical protein
MTQTFISTPCMQNMRMGMIAKEEEEAPHHHDFEVTIMIMHIHKKDIK